MDLPIVYSDALANLASVRNNNMGVVIFDTNYSSTAIPDSISQVGINVALVGGSADAFIGSRGFVVHVNDDGSYNTDYPITITKSKDGVVGAIISTVDIVTGKHSRWFASCFSRYVYFCPY